MKRILVMCACVVMLCSCARTAEISDISGTPTAADTISAKASPVPATARPVPTTTEQAFEFAEAQLSDIPPRDDPGTVFPFSSIRLLTSTQLSQATPYELEWAWREIAARAGAKSFRNYDFSDREWYEHDPDFSSEAFSQVEAMNIINIRNAVLEHYNNMKLVNNNRASVDLDGDGRKEAFSFTADKFSNEGLLQVGNTRFSIQLPQLDGSVYLCDIDRSDKKLELAIAYTDIGGDYSIAFYRYDKGELLGLGNVRGDRGTVRLFGDGTLDAHALETSILCNWRYRQRFTLHGDALVLEPYGIRPMRVTATLREELTLKDEKGNKFTLPKGSMVRLLCITRQRECIVSDYESGKLGMFVVGEENTVGEKGISPEEQFADLPRFT